MPAGVAVDVVVLALSREPSPQPVVLAVRRTRPPFMGDWALPGGLLTDRVDLEEAARGVLADEAGLTTVRHLEQLASFGRPDRDPRGRVVSVSYLGLLPHPVSVDDQAAWWPVLQPPTFGFDHDEIVSVALERLRAKLSYSNVAYGLLADVFTLRELQAVYEAVLDRPIDKRNFRKKVQSLRMVEEAEGQRRGSHRPAQLYRFTRRRLVLLNDVITA